MLSYEILLALLVVYAPLAGAVFAGFWSRGSQQTSMRLATASVAVSSICACLLFLPHCFSSTEAIQSSFVLVSWLDVSGLQASWSVRVDTLSIVMMFVVTVVSLLVHIYSFSYMEKDTDRALFFSYLSLFTFAMLMLVSADDFLQLFLGWEGVGLASYLLIGFWFQKPSAGAAAIKAFVTNRVGDAGFILGILTLFTAFGSVSFEPIFDAIIHNRVISPLAFAEAAPAQQAMFTIFGFTVPVLELAGFLLFIGAMGKSAQFLFHVWLPDAMEGPTPVSALIHAATMVTAGVFLVCRCSSIYEYAPVSASFITIIGAITALFAATIAVVQNDIKRVIAYSTCSQLGYMFFAAGLGVYAASIFHLFTHAFFKALLFLSAGAVIHGFHHQQDMRKMGGLQGKMPIIWGMMLLGTLSLTGFGIPGSSIGFAGFFSKDAIIETAFMQGSTLGNLAFISGLLAAALTSFYSWRLLLMVFHGVSDPVRLKDAHDAPAPMRWTLGILAVGAVFAGLLFGPVFLGEYPGDHNGRFWGNSLYHAPEYLDTQHLDTQHGDATHGDAQHLDAHHPPGWVFWLPLLVSVPGFLVALLMYGGSRGAAKEQRAGPLRLFLSNKWYFDSLYQLIFVRGIERIGDFCWKIGDQKIIDGGGPDGFAWLARSGSRQVSRLHSGYLFHYAFIMFLALTLLGAGALIGFTA